MDWIEHLSSFVDLTTISSVNVNRSSFFNPEKANVDDISNCLHLMPNLQCLKLFYSPVYSSTLPASFYSSLVPLSVKHLAISITKLRDCIPVLERFDQLSSFRCYFGWHETSSELEDFNNWLEENRYGCSFENESREYQIWFGESIVPQRNQRKKFKK